MMSGREPTNKLVGAAPASIPEPNLTPEIAAAQRARTSAELEKIAGHLRDHDLWVLRLLVYAKFWTFFLPWPLHHVQFLWGLRRTKSSTHKRYAFTSDRWLTFAIGIWVY